MPQAPSDYQTRYPVDFGDIDPATGQTVVQLYAADGGKSRGLLYLPPRGKPRTVVIMAHPRVDFAQHYSIPFWVGAGFAAFALNTRYLNNDSTMLHENLLLDIAAGMRYLRDEQGFERIVMLGNSGGGSLFAYYDAETRTPKGGRIASPPGGGPPDLNKFDLPFADGFIVLAAHPGQGIVLMGTLDAAVVDETDPFASDSSLDMYDERNGFRMPPSSAGLSQLYEPPHDGAADDDCLSHPGESQLYRLEPRSLGTAGRFDSRRASGSGELSRVRTGPSDDTRRVAFDLVGT
jgi:pimeloyl-ACP methyl ester carboxylesterase